jgi:hypothetical protein
LTIFSSASNKEPVMERTAMERSANSEPGSCCLPGPHSEARVGVARNRAAHLLGAALLEARKAEAD